MNKISAPVKYLSEKMDVSNKCQQGDKICFRYNERDERKYVGTFAIASFNKKSV